MRPQLRQSIINRPFTKFKIQWSPNNIVATITPKAMQTLTKKSHHPIMTIITQMIEMPIIPITTKRVHYTLKMVIISTIVRTFTRLNWAKQVQIKIMAQSHLTATWPIKLTCIKPPTTTTTANMAARLALNSHLMATIPNSNMRGKTRPESSLMTAQTFIKVHMRTKVIVRFTRPEVMIPARRLYLLSSTVRTSFC